MLGDGFTHSNPVASNASARRQPSQGITVRSRSSFRSAANIVASSPTVMPWRSGIGWQPTNVPRPSSTTGPATETPSIGFGRSSTTKALSCSAAAFIASSMVET